MYCAQQLFVEAEPLYLRVLNIREKDALGSLETMALLNDALNLPVKAEVFFKRALLIGEQGLGGDHPEVAKIMEAYAAQPVAALKKP